MKNRASVFLVEYADAGSYFFRFAVHLRSESNIVFLTFLPSVYFKAKALGYRAELIGKGHHDSRLNGREVVAKTKAVALGGISDRTAASFAFEVEKKLGRLVGCHEIVDIFVWNGASVSGVAARRIREMSASAVNCLFFEIANLPGKCFVDCEGANAESFLFKKPEFLQKYSVDLDEYSKWRSEYVASKIDRGFLPPQAKRKNISFWSVVDFIYAAAIGAALFGPFTTKLNGYLKRKKESLPFGLAPKNGFVFLPLQVSTDSQIILNSDFNNSEAIERVLSATNKTVVIKPHPAERDSGYLKSIVINNPRVVLSDENTFSLLSGADEVYTINSTVGLESLILGKKTTFLGRSYFSFFNQEDIPKYVLGHLVNMDFFSSEPLDQLECLRAMSIVKEEKNYVS